MEDLEKPMKRFYRINLNDKGVLVEILMDHRGCLDLVCHLPTYWLAVELEAWRDQAKHGDFLRITEHIGILVLDTDVLHNTPVAPSPLTLGLVPEKSKVQQP